MFFIVSLIWNFWHVAGHGVKGSQSSILASSWTPSHQIASLVLFKTQASCWWLYKKKIMNFWLWANQIQILLEVLTKFHVKEEKSYNIVLKIYTLLKAWESPRYCPLKKRIAFQWKLNLANIYFQFSGQFNTLQLSLHWIIGPLVIVDLRILECARFQESFLCN